MNNPVPFILAADRTLIQDRMVVGYYLLQRYEEGVEALQKLGVRPLLVCTRPDQTTYAKPSDRLLLDEEVDTWAETVMAQTGIPRDQSTRCYWCGDAPTGRLCTCYREVIMQDWVELRNRKLIAELRPGVIVSTAQCEDCGIPVPIPARAAQKFYNKNKKGVYYGRRHCHDHWLARRKVKRQEQPSFTPNPHTPADQKLGATLFSPVVGEA